MSRVTRVTAIFFTAAVAIGAACTGKSDEHAGPTSHRDAMAPLGDFPDATTPKRLVNADGWLLLDPGGEDRALVSQAIATLQPTNGSRVAGTVRFTATSEGVRAGLALGGLIFMEKYTVRVHMLGDCSASDGSSAGPSFNFDGSSLNPPADNTAGLLGEIQADINGEAKGEAPIAGPAIQGQYSIVGRSLVLHGKPDPMAKSDDGSGPRIGCGVIGVFADVGAPTGDR